nr:alpha/beta hydrolase [uncultured Campylobacter sp.]
MKISKKAAALALAAGMLSSLGAQGLKDHKNMQIIDVAVKRAELELISNLIYAQPPIYGYKNKALEMDVIKPVTKEPLPAVLFVPGGGFISSNKTKFLQPRMDIAQAGYVVAAIEYRVAPEVKFPDPLIDVKSAVRFLRANADRLGIDPAKIAVMGNSAGGYLAAMTGTTNGVKEFDQGENLSESSDVLAVIDIYGLSDLAKIGHGYAKELEEEHYSASAPEGLWLNGMATNSRTSGDVLKYPERAVKANPINYVSAATPPFLIMVGDQDKRVSPNQSELMHEALLQKGADSKLIVVKGADHGGPQWAQKQISDILIQFLDKNLKGKK